MSKILILLSFLVTTCFLLSSHVCLRSTHEANKRKRSLKCLNNGTWHEKLAVCICDYKWVGRKCSIWKHQTCYFGVGSGYRGQLSQTMSGERCALWTTDSNSQYPLGKNGIGLHNHCRNPDNDEKGIWCYVNSKRFIDYCNATVCPDSYKKLPNATSGILNDEEGSNTVLFLYGPLISGICGGVVALLLFVGISEYLRRSGHCKTKTKNKPNKKYSKLNKDNKTSIHKQQSLPDDTVRPLGGIVTVNLDTGEQTRQSGRLKGKDFNSNDGVVQKDSMSMHSVSTVNSAKSKRLNKQYPSMKDEKQIENLNKGGVDQQPPKAVVETTIEKLSQNENSMLFSPKPKPRSIEKEKINSPQNEDLTDRNKLDNVDKGQTSNIAALSSKSGRQTDEVEPVKPLRKERRNYITPINDKHANYFQKENETTVTTHQSGKGKSKRNPESRRKIPNERRDKRSKQRDKKPRTIIEYV